MPNAPARVCGWMHLDTRMHKITWAHAWAYKRKGFMIYICGYVNTHREFMLSGGLTKLFLFPLASIIVQACCQRACIAWGEVPICGSMWQGGSKSPLMNQYVGGLSLWWGCPRNATIHPGKNVCICSHQTLFMSADNLNLNGSCRIRVEEIWTHSQNPVVIMCMNETEEERLKVANIVASYL